ncbi:helix-turn-helix domain-containing protein [Nesterenkonia haasae]|uniref:helix-turn-helix domain-containing protein n=1 Tax=Nesterenkonia haasae TaxID=2587813 RepID=UPI0038B25186
MEQRWATVNEIAELYSISLTTVRARANSGEWPCSRQGRMLRFSPSDQQRIRDMWRPNRPDRIETREERKARRERIDRALDSYV